jgi:hypothetical protein
MSGAGRELRARVLIGPLDPSTKAQIQVFGFGLKLRLARQAPAGRRCFGFVGMLALRHGNLVDGKLGHSPTKADKKFTPAGAHEVDNLIARHDDGNRSPSKPA